MSKNILVVDCGSTGIRSVIVSSEGKIINREYKEVEIIHPAPGGTENNPEQIWSTFKEIVLKAMHKPLIKIDSIAITNQRATFSLWHKESGISITNFINWQDVRAADTVRAMNRNPVWLTLRTVAFFVGRALKNPLLTVTSMLKLNTDHAICKLKWVLDENSYIKELCLNDKVMFGTIDTWLLYKLTGNKVHGTDYTNAAATTLLNPFMMKWNTLFCKIFKIPMNILPKVYNTNDFFGNTDPEIFGKSIPVTAMVGDQQASLFGHRCFKPGDLKLTLGSGAFISMNVGEKPKFSTKGLFPLIAWTLAGKPEYALEGQVATVGTFIDWAVKKLKLFSTPQELDKFASETGFDGEEYCIPTLTGIRFPYFKPNIKASFSEISLETSKGNIAASIINGIAHRVVDIIEGMEQETKIHISHIKVDGGVSNSDILMQRLADLTGKHFYRSSESDLASIGAAYFAGLSTGIWRNKEEILNINIPSQEFTPKLSDAERSINRDEWKKHINTSQKIYKK